MSVWLLTGATGFLGRHVLAALHRLEPRGIEIVALGRRCPENAGGARFVLADLDDAEGLRLAIRELSPAVVIHAAGRTPPAAPDALYRGNTMATVHLLDALRPLRAPARVVLAGSAAELGPVEPGDLPVTEEHPCRPADSYGLSKWLASAAGLAARPPLEVVVARIFNAFGPAMPAHQAFGRFAGLLARADEPGPLRMDVGDLTPRRDFIDVRDAARALIALAERGRPGLVYHVGTGRSRPVGEGLDRLIRLSGRDVRVVTADPGSVERRGPGDSRACIDRIVQDTGWRPEISWDQSLEDLWADARSRSLLPLTAPPASV